MLFEAELSDLWVELHISQGSQTLTGNPALILCTTIFRPFANLLL